MRPHLSAIYTTAIPPITNPTARNKPASHCSSQTETAGQERQQQHKRSHYSATNAAPALLFRRRRRRRGESSTNAICINPRMQQPHPIIPITAAAAAAAAAAATKEATSQKKYASNHTASVQPATGGGEGRADRSRRQQRTAAGVSSTSPITSSPGIEAMGDVPVRSPHPYPPIFAYMYRRNRGERRADLPPRRRPSPPVHLSIEDAMSC